MYQQEAKTGPTAVTGSDNGNIDLMIVPETRVWNKDQPGYFAQESGRASPPTTVTPSITRSLIRAELEQIANQYEAADRRAKRAATIPDREAAEDERREAEGDFWAAGEQLADLFLLMIRHCKQYRPDILQLYLAELLRPELEPYARAIAKLEARR